MQKGTKEGVVFILRISPGTPEFKRGLFFVFFPLNTNSEKVKLGKYSSPTRDTPYALTQKKQRNMAKLFLVPIKSFLYRWFPSSMDGIFLSSKKYKTHTLTQKKTTYPLGRPVQKGYIFAKKIALPWPVTQSVCQLSVLVPYHFFEL